MEDNIKIRKQLVEETFNIEQMFRNIVKHSNEIYYVHDIHQKFVYVSPQSLQILGYTPDEMMIEWTKLVTDNPINKTGYEITKKALTKGQRQEPYPLEVYKKDGGKVLLEIEESPIKNEKGKVIGIVGAARDITERVKAEESLKELNLKFLTLINTIPNIIFLKDAHGRHLIVNKATEEFLGLTQKDIIGKTTEELLPPDVAEQYRKSDKEVFEMRKSCSDEHAIEKDGSVIILETFKAPLFNESGNAIGLIGVARDITKRKGAEQALIEREMELEIKTHNLEEANIALNVLLKKREEDKKELEENILLNIEKLVVPYLEKLKKNRLDERQEAYVSILESNLNEITSPFSQKLSSEFLNFTPTEIQISNLLRQGKTNKEIGELLHSSPKTIAFHRGNIRKKLGLKNKKTNLKSYLLSLT